MNNVEVFCEARQYLVESIAPLIDTFLTGIWDPCIKYTLIRDTTKIIDTDLSKRFCNIPKRHLPKVKFRLHDLEELTEVNIQNYYRTEPFLMFLGAAGIADEMYDFYCRGSFDPRFEHVFIAKYGHGPDDQYSGSKTAEAEYYMGMPTPLSIAYGMATEDGVI